MADTDRIARLVRLTRGLQPRYSADDGTLAAIKRLIALDARSDFRNLTDAPVAMAHLAGIVLDEERREAKTLLSVDRPLRSGMLRDERTDGRVEVERHTILNGLPPELMARDRLRNVRPDERVGPFVGGDGLLTWFDLYRPAESLNVVHEGEDRPLLLFTSARRHVSNGNVDLEKGSVWIRIDALAAEGADADGAYIGFPIADGNMTLETESEISDRTITLGGQLKGRLKIKIISPKRGPQACISATAKAPAELTITWGSRTVVELAPGSATLFDRTFEFMADGDVHADMDAGLVVFGARLSSSEFDAGSIVTSVARCAGTTGLVETGWAVPITEAGDASALGEALGEGSLTARCDGPIEVEWRGATVRGTMRGARLLVGDGRFSVSSKDVGRVSGGPSQAFGLWPLKESGRPLPLRTHFAEGFSCVIGCDAERGDFAAFASTYDATFDLPSDAAGRSLTYADADAITLINQRNGEARISVLALSGADPGGDPITMAIENAYLCAQGPRLGGMTGELAASDGTIDDIDGDPNAVRNGTLLVGMEVVDWIPTLPDPYVTNLSPTRTFGREIGRRGLLFASARWEDDRPDLEFWGSLGPPTVDRRPPTQDTVGKGVTRDDWNRDDSQTVDGSLPDHDAPNSTWMWDSQRPDAGPANAALDKRIGAAVGNVLPGMGDALLLDVSTNRHQIGVALHLGDRRVGPASATEGGAVTIAASSVRLPLRRLQVFTLPLIQWEPVRTLDIDQDPVTLGVFPTPLASADDGGPAVLGTRTMTLAPAIPDLALQVMVDGFASGTSMGLVTTLPFGLKAGIVLQPEDLGARRRDRAVFVAPRFDEANPLDGGLQLSLRAEGENVVEGEAYPSFEGVAVQTLNGVDLGTGTALGISVLGSTAGGGGSVEAMFNNEFADARPRVPLMRYDISGYGGSTFSDWRNPRGAFAEATKVQFQVMVGRTALEIVKFASVIYPWGIKVTRSVTIERRGGGGVIRRDSGWQAESDGLFDFRYKEEQGDAYVDRADPFVKHPGLIEGIYDVERIRPLADEAITLQDGSSVLPMAFDARIAIDGLAGNGRTRTEEMVGFLHVLPVGQPISEAEMAELLEREGPIGGPVDAIVKVGVSGFRVRALRAEVDLTLDGDQPIMAGVVRGTPRFGPAGAWSVIRQPGPSNPASPADAELIQDGTPIVRSGRAGTPSNGELTFVTARGPYRFLEGEDLFRVGTPKWDVGFVQTTETHAFLYRRPTLGAGSSTIESVLPPVFADLYARTSSSSLFPPVETGIELADRTYRLRIDQVSGYFRLDPPVALANPRPELILSEGPDRLRMFYDATTLSLAIEETSWSLSMPGLEMWNDMAGFEKTSGLRMDIVGGTATRPQMQRIETLIAEQLEELMDFVPGAGNRGVQGPVDLSATNCKVKVKPKAASYFEEIVSILPTLEAKFYGQTDIGSEIDTSSGLPSFYAGAKVGVDVRGQTPPTPWFFLFGVAVELGGKSYLSGPLAGSTKPTFEAKLYFGFGMGKEVGPFAAKVSFGIGGIVQYEVVWKYGGFLFFESKIALAVVDLKVFGEYAMLGYSETDISGVKKSYIEYQGELGINFDFGWIFSIKITVQITAKDEVK